MKAEIKTSLSEIEVIGRLGSTEICMLLHEASLVGV